MSMKQCEKAVFFFGSAPKEEIDPSLRDPGYVQQIDTHMQSTEHQ